ncbi:MAG TPA: hypothetical protein VK783_12890 [Bacteroidia bacterium]|nr:hypothetical protein [Bacteroidia bacterium]
MKKALLFSLVLAYALTTHAQGYVRKDSIGSRKYPFVHYHNPTADMHMKEGRSLTLHLFTDSGSVYTYTGPIFISDANSLLMLGGTVEYHGYTDGGNTYEERITTNPDDEITVVPHKEIEYISLVPRLKPVFGTLTIASLAAICIMVPIATVGYSTKNFNPGTIAEISAGVLAINAPLYKIFHIRRFLIKGSKPPINYSE